MTLRIGIDGACWLNRRGYGRFTRELLGALLRLAPQIEYTLLVDFDPADAPAIPSEVSVVRIATDAPGAVKAAADGRRTVRDVWRTSRALSTGKFDILFFPSAYTYVPVFGSSSVVVAIHDVIAEEFPEYVFPNRYSAALWNLKLLAARRQADLVMTVSEASRRAIAQRFSIPEAKIAVVSEAADPRFRVVPRDAEHDSVLARHGLSGERFFLYVGGISPHKNLERLLDAFAEARRSPELSRRRLVLVGDYEKDVFYSSYDALCRRVADLGLTEAVRFAGFVADEDLVHLYNRADAFVIPSLCEGFGLPVVEALACGAPVIASDRGSLPEVVGDVGLLIDPLDTAQLAAALRRVVTDLGFRQRLEREGPLRASQFSWDRGARSALAAFQSLVNQKAATPSAHAVDGAQS